jgi:hypothetical protein
MIASFWLPAVLLVHCKSKIDRLPRLQVGSVVPRYCGLSRSPIFASDLNIVDEFAGRAQQGMADGRFSIRGPMLPRAAQFP